MKRECAYMYVYHMWCFERSYVDDFVISWQGTNLEQSQFEIMDNKMKELGWDFDFSESNARSVTPLAIEDQPLAIPAVTWSKLFEIIVKLGLVEKEGQKVYQQLKTQQGQMPSNQGQRQLNELEDCLMNLDDEKNKLDKVHKYRKGQDWAMISCFESDIFVGICLQKMRCVTYVE